MSWAKVFSDVSDNVAVVLIVAFTVGFSIVLLASPFMLVAWIVWLIGR